MTYDCRTAGAIILKLVYDYDVGEGDDVLVDLIDKAVTEFSTISAPGAFLVDAARTGANRGLSGVSSRS